MRKLVLLAAVLFSAGLAAQTESSFGVKGGFNYNGNGDYFDSAEDAYKNPDRNLGYHVGIFGKIGEKLYFRPELVYTSTKSDYENEEFKMQKLDAPLLIGLKVLGPVSVFGGPSLQYILDTDFEDVTLGDVENDFTIGLNFGAAINFGSFGIDLRYERGFKENEVTYVDALGGSGAVSRIDTRPDQLILSLSLNL
jgi:hypothetical protein